jgi:hypothetical protein
MQEEGAARPAVTPRAPKCSLRTTSAIAEAVPRAAGLGTTSSRREKAAKRSGCSFPPTRWARAAGLGDAGLSDRGLPLAPGRAEAPYVYVAVHRARDSATDRRLSAGADDYVRKPYDP